jgi:hypothetical protein
MGWAPGGSLADNNRLGLSFMLYGSIGVPLQVLQLCQENGHDIHIMKHKSKNLNPSIYLNSLEIYKMVLNLHKKYVNEEILSGPGGPMPQKPVEVLHTLMTNQFFIFAVAIVLFLLVITLSDPGKSEAVISEFWI